MQRHQSFVNSAQWSSGVNKQADPADHSFNQILKQAMIVHAKRHLKLWFLQETRSAGWPHHCWQVQQGPFRSFRVRKNKKYALCLICWLWLLWVHRHYNRTTKRSFSLSFPSWLLSINSGERERGSGAECAIGWFLFFVFFFIIFRLES